MTSTSKLTAKKQAQIDVNNIVLNAFNDALQDYVKTEAHTEVHAKRLLSCSAYVLETDNYYVLKSYNTFVAVIDKSTNICYDALRYVYGFTVTSAKHIAKFASEYSSNYPFRGTVYTYYPVY